MVRPSAGAARVNDTARRRELPRRAGPCYEAASGPYFSTVNSTGLAAARLAGV
jgi:hypothetical protein